MILVCDSCKASFLVPGSLFTAGPRKVRCAKCGHIWIATGEEKHAAKPPPQPETTRPSVSFFPPPAPPVPHADEPQAPPRPPLRERLKPLLAVLARLKNPFVLAAFSFLFLLALLVGLKEPIIKAWPAAQHAYAWVHLAPPVIAPEKLVLQNVHSIRRYMDGAMHLVVDGKIFNQSDKTQVVPALQVEAMGPGDKRIQSWRIDPPSRTLAPGATIPFASAILWPEGTVVAVNLSFVEPPHDEP